MGCGIVQVSLAVSEDHQVIHAFQDLDSRSSDILTVFDSLLFLTREGLIGEKDFA